MENSGKTPKDLKSYYTIKDKEGNQPSCNFCEDGHTYLDYRDFDYFMVCDKCDHKFRVVFK